MNDFEERLKRATQQYSQKIEAEETARTIRQSNQANFLVEFWDKCHSVIEPILERVKERIEPEPPGKWSDSPKPKSPQIYAAISRSDKEDRVIFTVVANKQSILVFLADVMATRVRLHSVSGDLWDRSAIAKFQDIQEGPCKATHPLLVLTLDEVQDSVIEEQVVAFVERALTA